MPKRTIATLISVLLVLVLSVGSTVAYLQDTDSAVNVMTLGSVHIVQNEEERDENGDLVKFTQDQPLYPAVYEGEPWSSSIPWADDEEWPGGDEAWKVVEENSNVIDKFVTITNTGKSEAYVRTLIAYEGDAYNGEEIHIVHNSHKSSNPDVSGKFLSEEYLGRYEIDGVAYDVVAYTYKDPLAKEATTIPSLKQVYMDKGCDNEDVEKYGETYDILAVSQAVQVQGFEDVNNNGSAADDALNEAFNLGKELKHEDCRELIISWFEAAYDQHEQETTPDNWDGTADTDWYNDTDSEFMIMTAEQLAGFAKLVDEGKDFEGKTVKLGRDIDLKYIPEGSTESICFEPIGSYRKETPFKGTFDGQNYTIKNMSQNTWALDNGFDYSDLGLGLFGKVENATIKNLVMDNASISGESAICGTVAATAYGDCTFENITVKNSKVADYQYYAGGIVGWASGDHEYKNCNVDASNTIAAQWGDFDNSVGGVIGGAGGSATILLKDCNVACRIDAYNDVTSTYQWYAYRRCGMLIGNTGKTVDEDGTTYAAAPQLTCENVTVTYGDWANYTYCEFAGQSWPYVRVQAGVSNSAYSNPRYGHPTDANGKEVVDDNHVHNDGEDHFIECTFDQLYGGGQGVYGDPTHDGVTVVYNNK